MSHASPRPWIDLNLPGWAFVAWLVHQRQLERGPRLAPALVAGGDIEASRRARLMRELVPQDA